MKQAGGRGFSRAAKVSFISGFSRWAGGTDKLRSQETMGVLALRVRCASPGTDGGGLTGSPRFAGQRAVTPEIRKPYPRQAPLVWGTLVTSATRLNAGLPAPRKRAQ